MLSAHHSYIDAQGTVPCNNIHQHAGLSHLEHDYGVQYTQEVDIVHAHSYATNQHADMSMHMRMH